MKHPVGLLDFNNATTFLVGTQLAHLLTQFLFPPKSFLELARFLITSCRYMRKPIKTIFFQTIYKLDAGITKTPELTWDLMLREKVGFFSLLTNLLTNSPAVSACTCAPSSTSAPAGLYGASIVCLMSSHGCMMLDFPELFVPASRVSGRTCSVASTNDLYPCTRISSMSI